MENNNFWDFANDTVQEDMTLKTVYKAPYGTVYYKVNPTDSDDDILSIDLATANEYKNFAGNTAKTISNVGGSGVNIQYGQGASQNVIVGFDFPANVEIVPNYFLNKNAYLKHIFIPDSVKKIGNMFLMDCSTFNEPVKFNGVEEIGSMFLTACPAFNSDVILPSVKSIGFDVDNQNMMYGFICTANSTTGAFSSTFNSKLVMPNLEKVGHIFLYAPNTIAFNKKEYLSFPKLKQVGNNFLCGAGWKTTNFPAMLELPELETVDNGSGFLNNNKGLVELSIPKLTKLPPQFLSGCSNFIGGIDFSQFTTGTSLYNFLQGTKVNEDIDLGGITFSGAYVDISHFLDNNKEINSEIWLPNKDMRANDGYFMYYCSVFNNTIHNFNKITSAGSNFMSYCKQFNQPIDCSGMTSLPGNEFLGSCSAFNQEIDLSNADGNSLSNFGHGWTAFNSRILFKNGKVPAAINGFMDTCPNFNQPLDFSGVTSISLRFFLDCSSFNQDVDLSNVTSFSNAVMFNGTTTFNSNLTMPANATGTILSLLRSCPAFNKPLVLPEGITQLQYFLSSGCVAFNQPIKLPSTLTANILEFLNSLRNMVSYVDVGDLPTTLTTFSNAFTGVYNSPAVTQGIPIKGANRAAWIAKYPDITNQRKLLDYGS